MVTKVISYMTNGGKSFANEEVAKWHEDRESDLFRLTKQIGDKVHRTDNERIAVYLSRHADLFIELLEPFKASNRPEGYEDE